MHITPYIKCKMCFPGGSVVKNPLAVRETWVGSLDWEDPLEKGMATITPVFLPGKSIPGRAWQTTVDAVAKNQTLLSDFHFQNVHM